MSTPVIITAHATLDGLLGALLFDRLQDVDAAHAAIPVQSTDGLFHASAARLLAVCATRRQGFIAGLRASHDLPIAMVQRNASGAPHRALGVLRRSDFGNISNTYAAHAASIVEWTAEGDGDRVFELLQTVLAIGKRRNAGYGEVLNWHIEEGDDDGVIGPDGRVLRPVPVELLGLGRQEVIADAAWRPAYWNPINRAACYVPSGMVEMAQPDEAVA